MNIYFSRLQRNQWTVLKGHVKTFMLYLIKYPEIHVNSHSKVDECYGLTDCTPLKFICWNLNPNAMISTRRAFRKQEGQVLMNAMTATVKEAQGNVFAPCSTWRLSEKVPTMNYECEPSSHTNASGAVILDFSQCTFDYKPPSLWHFSNDSLNRLEQKPWVVTVLD